MDKKTTSSKKEKTSLTKPLFAIQQIYVKDVSLRSPNSPEIFKLKWQPELNFKLKLSSKKLSDGVYEITLGTTTSVMSGKKAAFAVRIAQAGVFTIKGFSKEETNYMLGDFCPNILFPYARAIIADLINQAGFPTLHIAPLNFDALYRKELAKKQPKSKKTKD